MRCLDSHLKWRGLGFFLVFLPFSFSFFFFFLPSLNYANALDVWSPLKTLSFACGLIAVLSAFTVNAHHSPQHKKSPPKGWKEFKAFKRQKRTKLGIFLCTLKRRIKYKFPPIGACYGSGTHIKALCYDIKGPAGKIFRAHHMRRRNGNNLGKKGADFLTRTTECSFWHTIEGTRNSKEVIFDQVFCLNRL